MVRHIISFKLKENSVENCKKMQKILLSMKENVPTVKNIDVRLDQLRSARSYDVFLSVDVEGWDALNVYQNDEYHCNVVKNYVHEVAESSVAIDYEY